MTSSPLNDLTLEDIVGVPLSPLPESIRDSLEIERIGDSWVEVLDKYGDLEAQPPFDSTFWKDLEASTEEKVEVLEVEVLKSGVLPDIFGNETDTEDEVEVEKVEVEDDNKPTIVTSSGVMNFCKFCAKFCGEQRVCTFHRCMINDCENKRTSKGFCNKHYLQAARRCTFEGCRNMEISKGLCRRHSGVPVKRKKCSENDCSNFAQKGGLCTKHGGIQKRCSFDGCSKNVINGGSCVSHGAVSKRCSSEGCTNKSIKGGRCITHGAMHKRCSFDGCLNQCVKEGRCISHGAKFLKCTHPGCNYSRQKDGLCKFHHPTYQKCINCQFYQVAIKGSMCGTCSGYRQNSEEYRLRDLINLWFQDLKIVHDRIIEGSCLRYRPDFFIETPKGHIIIVEVDEDHHKDYDVNCEVVRMFNIQQAIMTPIVFVRYNPDTYKPDGIKTKALKKKDRYNKLRGTIARLIHFPPDFIQGLPEVEYLYYPQPRMELLNEEYKQKINVLM
jgi:hypothetical protein